MPDVEPSRVHLRVIPAPQEPAPHRWRRPRAAPPQPGAAITPPCPGLAWQRPFMPGANAPTRAITAAILRQQGLLE